MRRIDDRFHTLILGVVAVALLVVYISLRGVNRMEYQLPEMPKISEVEIDGFLLQGPSGMVECMRVDAGGSVRWVVLPERRPADPERIEQILKAIASLELTELVSVTGSYGRFDLDEASRIRVAALNDGTTVREFMVGKRAPSYRHTYVKVPGDDGVYQAFGDFRGVFDLPPDALLDRTVLSFDIDRVTSLEGTVDGTSFNLDPENLTDEMVLNILDGLQAVRFMDSPPDGIPVTEIVIRTDNAVASTITIYPKQGNLYPALSSDSESPFYMFAWQGDRILSAVRGEDRNTSQ